MEAKEGMASEHEGKRDTEIHRRKNRIQSQAPLWVGVRYHNGLVQALGQEWNVLGSIWARAERKLQEGGSLGRRDGFPLGMRIRGRIRHSELVGP